MANKISQKDPRITLFDGGLKETLSRDVKVDPRFSSVSKYALHLIQLGRVVDEDNRRDAIRNIARNA